MKVFLIALCLAVTGNCATNKPPSRQGSLRRSKTIQAAKEVAGEVLEMVGDVALEVAKQAAGEYVRRRTGGLIDLNKLIDDDKKKPQDPPAPQTQPQPDPRPPPIRRNSTMGSSRRTSTAPGRRNSTAGMGRRNSTAASSRRRSTRAGSVRRPTNVGMGGGGMTQPQEIRMDSSESDDASDNDYGSNVNDGGNGNESRFYDDYFIDYRKLMSPAGAETIPPASSRSDAAPRLLRTGDVLACRAHHVRRVHVLCDSQLVRLEAVDHGVEVTAARTPYVEVRARIPAHAGACHCVARPTNPGTAVVRSADLILSASDDAREERKRSRPALSVRTMTITPAAPTRIAEGRTAQLACASLTTADAADEGTSASSSSQVVWRKDGVPIQANTDSNLILADDGSLIIAAARLTDSGSYTCAPNYRDKSDNSANTLPSTSTDVIVYVDGEWSPWSDWHGMCPQAESVTAAVECTVLRGQVAMTRGGSADAIQRVLPRQRRQRACNNPAPLNDGRACPGSDEEFRMCRHACTLDGDWSAWSDWTECDASCARSRHRRCDAPAPANGGANCAGDALERRECGGGACRVTQRVRTRENGTNLVHHRDHGGAIVHLDPGKSPVEGLRRPIDQADSIGVSAASPSAQVYVLASLGCVAFLLVVIALLVAALLCTSAQRRRANGANKFKKRSAGAVNLMEVDGARTPSGAPSGAPSFIAGLDAFFVGENGEKMYFPLAANHNNESVNVRTVLLSETHQRYLTSGETRASTPAAAAARFLTLASAKSTPAHFVRHTASSAAPPTAASSLLHQPHHRQHNAASGYDTARSPRTVDAPPASNSGSGSYFLNRRQLAVSESRVPLIAAGDSSPASNNGSGGGGSGSNSYRRGTETSPYASSASESGSLLLRQLPSHSSPYYDPRPVGVYGGSETDNNYATLYDYAASASLPSRGGAPHDDSGNHSSSEIGAAGYGDQHYYYTPNYSQCPGVPGEGGFVGTVVESPEWEESDPTVAPTIVAAQVDSECARIELRRSGVGVTIGERTFTDEHTVFLAASDRIEDRPALAEGETWLSSVVSYGTCHRSESATSRDAAPSMRRPVVLSFEHCASLFPKDNWQFVLYGDLSSVTEPGEGGDHKFVIADDNNEIASTTMGRGTEFLENKIDRQKKNNKSVDNNKIDNKTTITTTATMTTTSAARWEALCVVGAEDLNTRVYVQLERERCHVMSAAFGRYLLAGRPRRTGVAAQKRVHLAAYCSVAPDYGSVTAIRVYCVPETQMCVAGVRQQEEEAAVGDPDRGLLLAEAENFPMLPRGALCCCLEEIGADYALHPDSSQYLEIPDSQHQWCAQNGLHFALNLRRLDDSPPATGLEPVEPCRAQDPSPPLIAGRIVIYQKGNPSERQILAFRLDRSQLPENRRRRLSTSPSSVSQCGAPRPGPGPAALVSRHFQLGFALRQQLCELLDHARGPSDAAAGWIALARRLGFDRYTQYFGTHPGCSPASLVLDLWEARVGASERAPLDLMQTLRVLGHMDAAALLEPRVVAAGQRATAGRRRPVAPPHRPAPDTSGSPYPPPRLPPPPPPPTNPHNAILNLC